MIVNKTGMTLALGVWACTLPFVFLLVGPLLGFRAALTAALVLLLAISIACWAACASGAAERSRRRP